MQGTTRPASALQHRDSSASPALVIAPAEPFDLAVHEPHTGSRRIPCISAFGSEKARSATWINENSKARLGFQSHLGGIEVTRTTYAFALLSALGALALAGCGGGGGSSSTEGGSSGNEQPASSSAEGGATPLTGAEVSGLGTVLVDSEGFTVYEFAKDKGTTSSCYGGCEESWPPVTTANSAPTAGEGAMSSQLGTTKRKDGTLQVTYAGHPLYTFVEDQSPGEANGNGTELFGGKWSALDEAGSAVEGTAGEETEASGGGYGY